MGVNYFLSSESGVAAGSDDSADGGVAAVSDDSADAGVAAGSDDSADAGVAAGSDGVGGVDISVAPGDAGAAESESSTKSPCTIGSVPELAAAGAASDCADSSSALASSRRWAR